MYCETASSVLTAPHLSLRPAGWQHAGEAEPAAMEEDIEGDGTPVEDLTYDPDMMPGVDTSNDIIEFYGKYGKESPVKFFYCNRCAAAALYTSLLATRLGGSAGSASSEGVVHAHLFVARPLAFS
jgi:hypothetical protein